MRRSLLVVAVAVSLSLSTVPVGVTLAASPVPPSPPSSNPPASGTSVSGSAVVSEAMKFLGYPYSYTGASPATGFSCIGFVSYVYHQLGVNMPGDLGDAMAAYPQISEGALEPGDIVFFQNTWWPGVSHVAIYIGGGQIIHAENPQAGVRISSISNDPSEGNYWAQHYLTAERPWSGTAATTTTAPVQSTVTSPATSSAPIAPNTPGTTATVVVSSLNVRSGPSMSDTVVTVVSEGTSLTVLGHAHHWLKVQLADGTVGWVIRAGTSRRRAHAAPSTAGGATGQTGTPSTASAPPAAPKVRVGKTRAPSRVARVRHSRTLAWRQTTMIRVNGLRVHSRPSLAAPVITTLMEGQRVGVLGHVPGWLKVGVTRTLMGWTMSQWTTARNATRVSSSRAHSSPARKIVGSTAVQAGINVHTSPSIGASIVTVTDGQPVRVLGSVNGWVKVELENGEKGWVSVQFVPGYSAKSAATQGKSSPSRATHPALQGGIRIVAGVRIHSGPSLSASVVASTTPGTTVRVLGYRHGFAHVQTSSGIVGWIASQFVGGAPATAASTSSTSHAGTGRTPSYRVTATVRLHAAPGLNTRVIGSVAAGTRVEVRSASRGWDLVRLPDGQTGYVDAIYVAA